MRKPIAHLSIHFAALLALSTLASQRAYAERLVQDQVGVRQAVMEVNRCCKNSLDKPLDDTFKCAAGNEAMSCLETAQKKAEPNYQEGAAGLKKLLASKPKLKAACASKEKSGDAWIDCLEKNTKGLDNSLVQAYWGGLVVKDMVKGAIERAGGKPRDPKLNPTTNIASFVGDDPLKLDTGPMECPKENPMSVASGSQFDPRVLRSTVATGESAVCETCVGTKQVGASTPKELAALSSLSAVNVEEAFDKGKPILQKQFEGHLTEVYGERLLENIYIHEGKEGVQRRLAEAQNAMGCFSGHAKTSFPELAKQIPNFSDEQRAEMRQQRFAHMTYAAQCHKVISDRLLALGAHLGNLKDPVVTLSLRAMAEQTGGSTAGASAVEMGINFIPVAGFVYGTISQTQGIRRQEGECNKYLAHFDSTQKKGGENYEKCKNMALEFAALNAELSTLDRAYPSLAMKSSSGKDNLGTMISQSIGVDPRVKSYNADPTPTKESELGNLSNGTCMDQFREDPKNPESPMIAPPLRRSLRVISAAGATEVSGLLADTRKMMEEVCDEGIMTQVKKITLQRT